MSPRRVSHGKIELKSQLLGSRELGDSAPALSAVLQSAEPERGGSCRSAEEHRQQSKGPEVLLRVVPAELREALGEPCGTCPGLPRGAQGPPVLWLAGEQQGSNLKPFQATACGRSRALRGCRTLRAQHQRAAGLGPRPLARESSCSRPCPVVTQFTDVAPPKRSSGWMVVIRGVSGQC